MRVFLVIFLAILCVSCETNPEAERAEKAVRQVTVCEIVAEPEAFSQETVSLRARFEHTGDKTVAYDNRCPDDSIVWLEPAPNADAAVYALNKKIVEVGSLNAMTEDRNNPTYTIVHATLTTLVSWDQAAPIGMDIVIKPIHAKDVELSQGSPRLPYFEPKRSSVRSDDAFR